MPGGNLQDSNDRWADGLGEKGSHHGVMTLINFRFKELPSHCSSRDIWLPAVPCVLFALVCREAFYIHNRPRNNHCPSPLGKQLAKYTELKKKFPSTFFSGPLPVPEIVRLMPLRRFCCLSIFSFD